MRTLEEIKTTTKNPGKISIPINAKVSEKELIVAKILVKTGKDVEFIPAEGGKTPDIMFGNQRWEIKSPEGHGKRTIQHQLQRGATQSRNIIIDTSLTDMSLETIVSRIDYALKKNQALNHSIKKIIICTRSKKLLTIK